MGDRGALEAWAESITSQAVREAFANSAEVFCEYCGRQVYADIPQNAEGRATGDHRIPRSRGGLDSRANMAICCFSCNRRKAMLTEAEFRSVMTDGAALRLLRDAIVQQERPGNSRPTDVRQWQELKENRRLARLMGRLVEADPHCQQCHGRGDWRRGGKVHPCKCRVLDAKERGEVDASRTDSAKRDR